MKTYTVDFDRTPLEYLDGNLHAEEKLVDEGTSHLALQNVGPRVIAILGFETLRRTGLADSKEILGALGTTGINIMRRLKTLRKEHVVLSVTPGKVDDISPTDTDLMEEALRDALKHPDYLLGDAGSIRAFQAVKDRAMERPIVHSPLYEELIHFLLSHGFDAAKMQQFSDESKKDVHPWQEIVRNIFQTDDGRKFWRQLRPIYLARKRREEEFELSEFRAIHRRFQSLLRAFRPVDLFVGTTSNIGRLEIIARHLTKSAGDFDARFGKHRVQTLHSIETGVTLGSMKMAYPADPNI